MKKGWNSRPDLAHVAKAIEIYLDENHMTMHALGEKIGVPGRNKSSVVTNWLHAVLSPSEPYRSRLAKLLNVAPEFLTRQEQAIGPARKALMLVPKKEVALVADGPAQTKLLRSFEEHDDGTVTVRLNSRIPLEKAKEVFKILMDVSI